MIRTFELEYGDELTEITKELYKFSVEWDGSEVTDDEWEATRMEESRELATKIIKILVGEELK